MQTLGGRTRGTTGDLATQRQERPDPERGFRPPARQRDARMQDRVTRLQPLGANAGHG